MIVGGRLYVAVVCVTIIFGGGTLLVAKIYPKSPSFDFVVVQVSDR